MAQIDLSVSPEELPEMIPMGQYAISKKEYLEMLQEGTLPNGVGHYLSPSAYNVSGLDTGEAVSDKYDRLKNKLNDLLSLDNIEFQIRAGHDYSINPFDQNPSIMDDSAMVGWVYLELGLAGWTSIDAVMTVDELSKTDKLLDVTANTTSSDSVMSKVKYLTSAQIGDLLFFDTYTRNSMVGIYMGDGLVLTLDDTGVSQHPLWIYSDKTFDFTGGPMMEYFNGRVRRANDYNTEGFVWYAQQNTNDL